MTNNTYDSKTHTYRIGGVRVPSVTQVLADSGVIDDRWFTEESRERGRIVASATALYDKRGFCEGGLDKNRVPEEYWPYVQAWLDWRVAAGVMGDGFIRIEEPMWHETLRYGVRPDRVLWFDGVRTVAEIKTGGVARWHELQTAGQLLALSDMFDFCRVAVYLNPGKPAKVVPHDDLGDCDAWRCFLGGYHWKHKGESNA